MAEGNISTSDLSSYVLDSIFDSFFATRTYLVIVAESNI